MRPTLPLVLAPLALASCASTFTGDPPAGAASASYATAYWYRGTPINVRGVLQGDFALSVPTSSGGTFGATAWGNMDVRHQTGDAISPDGHGGDLTEVDFVLDYTETIEDVDLGAGLVGYNFPNGVGGSTNEAFVSVATGLWGMSQSFTLYYDFDELDDLYASLAVDRSFPVSEELAFTLSASLGWMGADQAGFYFGRDTAGLSDLNLSGALDYAIDPHTALFLSVTLVRVPDGDLRDALSDAGLEDGGTWLASGVSWSF